LMISLGGRTAEYIGGLSQPIPREEAYKQPVS
jgi:hypothetical protein